MTKEKPQGKEGLIERYPFMGKILALEGSSLGGDVAIIEGHINRRLLEKKTHEVTDLYIYDGSLPSYRIFSQNPLMPDKEGPVPTYAITGEKVTKLGLLWQRVDNEYVENGYDGEARLNPDPHPIKDELTAKKVENPDFIVCRNREGTKLTFEIYGREEKISYVRLFRHYKKWELLALPEVAEFLRRPLCSTVNLFEKPSGVNIEFEDLEEITYFYDFSSVNTMMLSSPNRYSDCEEEEKWLTSKHRGNDYKNIGEQLEKLIREGKKVTHIVRSTEKYGGGTNESVWREYLKAQIYEIKQVQTLSIT